MNKAAKIRALLHLSNDEIVQRTGYRPEYVRAVRQRTDGDGSPISSVADRRWSTNNREYLLGLHRTYHHNVRKPRRAALRREQFA